MKTNTDPGYWSAVAPRMGRNATNPSHDASVSELNHAMESRMLAAQIDRRFGGQPPIVTLDIGAGAGRFTEVAARFGAVDALEPSGLADVLQARFRGDSRVTVIRRSLQQFQQQRPYDVVIMSGFLMEFADSDVERILQLVSGWLTPRGLVLVRDLSAPREGRRHGDSHYVYCSRPMAFWRQAFAKSGLAITSWSYSHNPFLLYHLSRHVPFVRPLERAAYSPPLYGLHAGLKSLLGPLWSLILSAGNRHRMVLFFAEPARPG